MKQLEFKWEYLQLQGDKEWGELQVLLDETRGLAKSGIVEFVVPEEMKASQLYGSEDSLYWIRLLFHERRMGLYTNPANFKTGYQLRLGSPGEDD